MTDVRPRKDRATLIAAAATVGILAAIAYAVIMLYLLIEVKSVQHGNSGILGQINVIVNNHTGTLTKLHSICDAIPGCKFSPTNH